MDGPQSARLAEAGQQVAARPTADTARSIQFSCQLLSRNEDEFFECFYQCMVEHVQKVRELTPPEGRPLCDALVRSVLWAALTQDAPEVVEATFHRIGAGYRHQGFRDDWYRSFGQALLQAARQTHRGGWDSRLSSNWVAYYTWLRENLSRGSAAAWSRPQYDPSPESDPAPAEWGGEAEGAPAKGLDEIFIALRIRYFPDDERGLAAICARVALRTGVNLRVPREDQKADPEAISAVLRALLVLGYSLWSFPHAAAGDRPTQAAGASAGDGSRRRGVFRLFGRVGR
ncbi:hypothetical protein ACH4UM_18160 [Streptomyces sp. NPDC020801]|uniref:hypothetical protein n=1 Tax=unclassified Streptomyces TaxID=2593676 RepID=UPI00379F37DF